MAGSSEQMKAWIEDPTPAKEPPLMKDLAKQAGGGKIPCGIDEQEGSCSRRREFSQKLVNIVGPLNGPKATPAQKGRVSGARPRRAAVGQFQLRQRPVDAAEAERVAAAGGVAGGGDYLGGDGVGLPSDSGAVHHVQQGHLRLLRRPPPLRRARHHFFVGRTFIIVANLAAFLIALKRPPIFELAVQYAFSGFASLAPVMLAALFWKRSTKWGAFAAAAVRGGMRRRDRDSRIQIPPKRNSRTGREHPS